MHFIGDVVSLAFEARHRPPLYFCVMKSLKICFDIAMATGASGGMLRQEISYG